MEISSGILRNAHHKIISIPPYHNQVHQHEQINPIKCACYHQPKFKHRQQNMTELDILQSIKQ